MITGITGDIGSGKTVLMTALGHLQYDTKPKTSIYANYEIKGVDYTPISEVDDFLNIPTPKNLILLDELWKTADARHSMGNLANVNWAAESRKIGATETNVIWTGQLYKQLDLRIRELTQFWITPSIAAKDKQTNKPMLIRADCTIFHGEKSVKKHFLMPTVIKTSHGIIDVCDSYDTREKVQKTEGQTLKETYKDMIKKYKASPQKIGELKALLVFDEDIPPSDASLVASYIKARQAGGC